MGLLSQVVTALGLCVSLERVMTHILISPKHMSVFVGKFKELRIDRPFSAFCNSTAPERGRECRDCMDLRRTEYQSLRPRLRAQVWSTEGEDQTL